MLTPAEARALLDTHAPENELWPLHCQLVGRIARLVAEAAQNNGEESGSEPVNADTLEVYGLLHDIGRCKSNGPMHGWAGFVLLRSLGHADAGRGCLTHWFKGRNQNEMAVTGKFGDDFLSGVYGNLQPQEWLLTDSILSFADSCVMHNQIVSLKTRHQDLRNRYGASAWMTRTEELANQHADQISARLGFEVHDLVAPLYGEILTHD